MASSSTAPSARSGSLRLLLWHSMHCPGHAAGPCQNPSPPGPPHTWLPGKASVLPRTDKLPPALHTWPVSKNNILTWTACPVGQESLYACSLPAPQGRICQTLLNATLAGCDHSKPVVVQMDVSKYGLGATLIQSSCPIAFASKMLPDVKTCYVNIERECLSVCFSLEKFHTYIYGRHVMVENDHKLLEMIQHKPIHVAPPQLQLMLLHMQKYNYTIWYKPGKDMVLANCISSFASNSNYLPIPTGQNVQHVQLSNAELDIIWGLVECDLVYSTIYHLTIRGWPECQQDVPHIARHFWCMWDELSINSGLLLKETRVCISPELLNHTLADLHRAHQCISRMQAQAREAVYWPGIDANIANHVCQCTICTKHKASPPAQPMLPWDIPDGPW